MSPQRIQRQRTKGWRMPEGAVYVGRPSKWGNPFVVGAIANRRGRFGNIEEIRIADSTNAVRLYRDWIANPMDSFRTGFFAELPTSLDLQELRGRDLACWCPLDSTCHADVLLELANGDAP